MSKKIITSVLTLAMIFSVICNPALGYATTEATASDASTTVEQTETEEKEVAPKVPAVSKLTVKQLSSSKLKLTWKKVKGASGYEVYRYNKKTKKYVRLISVKGTSCNNIKLKADTTYVYKVRAYITANNKKYYGAFAKAKGKTDKTDQQKVALTAKSKLGAKYRYGCEGPRAFDCSGFVYWTYKNADVNVKKKVKRTSAAGLYSSLKKYKVGSSINSIKKAQTGDIIFFKHGGRISHVGIYYKNGQMIHAANPRKGVIKQSVRQFHNSGSRVVGLVRIIK